MYVLIKFIKYFSMHVFSFLWMALYCRSHNISYKPPSLMFNTSRVASTSCTALHDLHPPPASWLVTASSYPQPQAALQWTFLHMSLYGHVWEFIWDAFSGVECLTVVSTARLLSRRAMPSFTPTGGNKCSSLLATPKASSPRCNLMKTGYHNSSSGRKHLPTL